MDRRNSLCMIGGGAAGPYGTTASHRLTLRFRPIAPKPPPDEGGSGCFPAGININAPFAKARAKRKYVRVSKTKANISKKRKGISVQKREDDSSRTATLQLLPEKADDHQASPKAKAIETWCKNPRYPFKQVGVLEKSSNSSDLAITWLHMNGTMLQSPDPTVAAQQIRTTKIETWVIAESLTHACNDAQEFDLGRTDEERIKKLGSDDCPGFFSDLSNRVRWVNGAFKAMVGRGMMIAVAGGAGGGGSVSEVAVGLVAKDDILQHNPRGNNYMFSCKVKVQYMWREETWSGGVMPCDVWRMVDSGGFAWRLDVKAALRLGC